MAWVSFFSAISGDHKGDPRRRRYPRRLAKWCFSQRQEISPSKTGVSSCKKYTKSGFHQVFHQFFGDRNWSQWFQPKNRRPHGFHQVLEERISPSQNRDPNVCHLSMILAKKSDDPLRIAWNLALSTTAPHQKSKGPRFAESRFAGS